MTQKINRRKPTHLLPIIAMSDESIDPLTQLNHLGRGGVFIFRHYDAPAREQLAETLARQAKQQQKRLLIAGDAQLAYRLKSAGMAVAGVHYPEWQCKRLGRDHHRRSPWIISAAAHNLPAIYQAASAGADWIILSPAFSVVKEQEEKQGMGVCRLAAYVRQSPIPVYGCGGFISARQRQRYRQAGLDGFASVRAFR